MFNRAEFKSLAKAQISGNIGILFLCSLVYGAIIFAASLVGSFSPLVGGIASSLASFLLTPPFAVSLALIYLALINGVKPVVGDIFKGFEYFAKALWLYFLVTFFTILWSMLLVVPGIIKGISYSMAFYILAENPDMTAREALNESKRITKFHIGDLFILELSFIGWVLLIMVTCGLAAIYVGPYMQATIANAYKALSAAAGTGDSFATPAPDAPVIDA